MLITVISALTALGTIVFMYFNGSKKRWSWLISLGNQPLWLWLIFLTDAWGLLPLQIVMVILAIRGWRKWQKT